MKVSAKQKQLADALAAEIREYCAAHADAANAAKYARYFKEGYDAWGLMGSENALWVEQEPQWLVRYAALGIPGFLQLGEELFAGGKFEEGALATRFLSKYLDALEADHLPGIACWFKAGIRNWAHTDVLCMVVLEPLLVRERITLDDLADWRASAHLFQRRAVPVAMLGLLKQARIEDAVHYVSFLRPLMMDPERPVQQGLGWFLRETWKRHPAVAEAVLLEWKDTAPRTIFQYATEKMSAEQKSRYRKTKGA
ncbi:MAG: DNA alkylation repair protein [Bryobacterales bacterium]|nr:DNA alkylation repair protein [Bryobacterales bacterium]